MYKRTIWQDHVEGIQDGTDMSAANFNNLEAGVMEAAALAALNAANSRYYADMAKNAEVITIEKTLIYNTKEKIFIPTNAIRNTANYCVNYEIISIEDKTVASPAIIITDKEKTHFYAENCSSSKVKVIFHVSGGMI